MTEFKKGDQVELKSGGPAMTIQNIGDFSVDFDIENGALCVWFEGYKPYEKVFDIAAIKKYDEDYEE